MSKKLFQDYSQADRIEMLDANAEKMDDMTYNKSLSDEELEAARIDFTQLAIEIAAKTDELKAITERYKLELKPMQEMFKDTLRQIRSKQKEVKEKVYHLADHEAGMMETYNGLGELISTRRLTTEENQLSIHSSRNLRIASNE